LLQFFEAAFFGFDAEEGYDDDLDDEEANHEAEDAADAVGLVKGDD
jgi:hypothetical protein